MLRTGGGGGSARAREPAFRIGSGAPATRRPLLDSRQPSRTEVSMRRIGLIWIAAPRYAERAHLDDREPPIGESDNGCRRWSRNTELAGSQRSR